MTRPERITPAPLDAGACPCGLMGPSWQEVPDTAFCGTMAEARRWAGGAHRLYVKAIVLAAFEALDPEDRAAFLAYVEAPR